MDSLGSASVFQRSNGGIEHRGDLAMPPARIVVPVLNRTAGLPFEGQTGVFNGKREFATGSHDGAKSAVAACHSGACRHRDISPSAGKRTAAPPRFVLQQQTGSGEHRKRVAEGFWPPAAMPDRYWSWRRCVAFRQSYTEGEEVWAECEQPDFDGADRVPSKGMTPPIRRSDPHQARQMMLGHMRRRWQPAAASFVFRALCTSQLVKNAEGTHRPPSICL